METITLKACLVKPIPDTIDNENEVRGFVERCCEKYTSASKGSVNYKELKLISLGEKGDLLLEFSSSIPLDKPGKALTYFTKLLLKEEGCDYYQKQVYGAKLFLYVLQEENVPECTVTQLIAALAGYLEKNKGDRTSKEISAVENMKELAINAGMIEAKYTGRTEKK